VSSQRLPNDPAEALHGCCQCLSPEDRLVPFLLPYIVAVCYYHTLLPCRHFLAHQHVTMLGRAQLSSM